MEKYDSIFVFTGENPQEIIEKGGSESWTLDPDRAAKCRFLVCAQNRQAGNRFAPTEQHREAFLVGEIRQVRFQKREKRTKRFMIHLSSYARVSKPRAWRTGRNPVKYTSLKKLGIAASTLNFKTMSNDGELKKKDFKKQIGGQKMGRRMEGTTGWFSDSEPEFDSVPVIVIRNDDGSVDVEFEYPGDGTWNVHLIPDDKWNSLIGHGTCARTRATITWAFLVNNASRRWLLVGEWIQDGITSRWWTELLETEVAIEAQPTPAS